MRTFLRRDALLGDHRRGCAAESSSPLTAAQPRRTIAGLPQPAPSGVPAAHGEGDRRSQDATQKKPFTIRAPI